MDPDDPLFESTWARCAPLMQATMDYHESVEELSNIKRKVQSWQMQFWPATDSVVVTCIVETSKRRILDIVVLGGKESTIAQMAPEIEHWAKNVGCVAIRFDGRPGWQRLFPARSGYRAITVTMEKEL